MAQRAAQQRLVDDERTRLPALIERVRRHAINALRRPSEGALSSAERMRRLDIATELDLHAQRFCEAFVEAPARRLASASEPDSAGA
jgi:hypothetical protein